MVAKKVTKMARPLCHAGGGRKNQITLVLTYTGYR